MKRITVRLGSIAIASITWYLLVSYYIVSKNCSSWIFPSYSSIKQVTKMLIITYSLYEILGLLSKKYSFWIFPSYSSKIMHFFHYNVFFIWISNMFNKYWSSWVFPSYSGCKQVRHPRVGRNINCSCSM